MQSQFCLVTPYSSRYIRDNLTTHNMWGVRLVLTRYLYLLNVLLNLFIMDIFLGRKKSLLYEIDVVYSMCEKVLSRFI